jgi:hypothetical protein
LLALRVAAGDELFTRAAGSGRIRALLTRRTLAVLAICVVIGMTGVYYAVFTVILVASMAVVRAIGGERRALLNAATIAVVIGSTLLANDIPNIAYRVAHGPNRVAGVRQPSETELYGLRFTELVLPIEGHRIGALADIRQRYDQTEIPPHGESSTASLGFIGVLGLMCLIVITFGAAIGTRRLRAAPALLRHAGVATLVAFGLATTGGLSTLIAYEITPTLRAWNRISPFIAFLRCWPSRRCLTDCAAGSGRTRELQ